MPPLFEQKKYIQGKPLRFDFEARGHQEGMKLSADKALKTSLKLAADGDAVLANPEWSGEPGFDEKFRLYTYSNGYYKAYEELTKRK